MTGRIEVSVKNLYIPKRAKTVVAAHLLIEQATLQPLTYLGDSQVLPVICSVALSSKAPAAFNFDSLVHYQLESGQNIVRFSLRDEHGKPLQMLDNGTEPVIVLRVSSVSPP